MNKRLTAFTLSALLMSGAAFSEVIPAFGDYDPHVRVVHYNKQNVTKLVTFFGVSSHVEFSKSETILDIATGDPSAWELIPRTNNLYIRPKAKNPDTNLTIVTNKRTYQFALVTAKRAETDKTAWKDPNLIYSLSFTYDEEEKARERALQQAEDLRKALNKAKEALDNQANIVNNTDYWVAGSEQISPTKVKDDGRFIYLTFSNNRDMPSIYEVNEYGQEFLINSNVKGNTIVVHRMVRQLRLRKGNAVACLINRSFDLNSGKDNTTGTISNDVVRTIKGNR